MELDNIGATKEGFRAAKGSFDDDLSVKSIGFNESWKLRILGNPHLGYKAWIPYQALNRDNELETRWHTIMVPKEGSIIHKFANADQRIQMANTNLEASKCTSRAEPDGVRFFLCFDRRDEKPIVRRLQTNWTVFRAIESLLDMESEEKPGYLEHGLIFMYDLFVGKRTKDPDRRADYTNTEYYVKPLSATYNRFAQVVPIAAARDRNSEARKKVMENLLKWEVFTQAELDAIKNSKIDLAKDVEPKTDAEILEILRKNPIYINARNNKDKALVFPFPKELAEWCQENGVPVSFGATVRTTIDESTATKPSTNPNAGSIDFGELAGAAEKKTETATEKVEEKKVESKVETAVEKKAESGPPSREDIKSMFE